MPGIDRVLYNDLFSLHIPLSGTILGAFVLDYLGPKYTLVGDSKAHILITANQGTT